MKPAVVVVVAVVVAVTVAASPAAGPAIAATPGREALIDSTARFLQESQGTDGGFAEPGGPPSQGVSGWTTLALAATGVNPLDQARCGASAFAFLEAHFQEGLEEELAWPQAATTAFERELLVVDATGPDANPHDFAGYDLVAEILGRQLPDGSFPYTPDSTAGGGNGTIFAILALAPVAATAPAEAAGIESAIERGAEWVVGAEDEDGGWYYSGRSPESEVDMTGAALEALVVAGPPQGEPQRAAYERAIADGLAYLHASQSADGGFPALPRHERETNVASTAWATQAIWATGGDPEEWKAGPEGREPLDYLASMQQPDGHIRWRASSDLNGIWMTAYVTPAFAGQALPISAAARFDPAASHGEAADCDAAGQGGEAPRPQEGVIAGGGGHSAPLFSRPKRQSEGRTPGGARVVHGAGLRARDHGSDRRGDNLHQAGGTETAEPGSSAEGDQEVESVAGDTAAVGAVGVGSGAGGGGGGPGGGGGHLRPRNDGGAPIRTEGPARAELTTTGEEVSGVVIGSPGGGGGKLAPGAPGLRSAGAGSGAGDWPTFAIGAAALLAALGGAGRERRRGRLA